MRHEPVLLQEALEFLNLREGGTYVDGTLGLGGHTEAILQKTGPETKVIGIDWDERSLALARERFQPYAPRTTLVEGNFSGLPDILRKIGNERVDGILLDLGISSAQLEEAERGFSFQRDGPLDMRMSQHIQRTAADLLTGSGEREIGRILREYGEETAWKQIARGIGRWKSEGKRIGRTLELADLVWRLSRRRHERVHPATRVFQALRIAVNGELENLKKILDVFDKCLGTDGRMVVISFHSLEDRLVKEAFRQKEREGTVRRLTPKPIRPSEDETRRNPRARSAKLRAAQKM